MEPVIIRNVKIGEGRPKICAPIVGRDEASILEEARAICGLPVDVAEWRADGYRHISHIEKTIDTARRLRETLKSTVPLLFTVRTARDGGRAGILPGGLLCPEPRTPGQRICGPGGRGAVGRRADGKGAYPHCP